jgi:hypothetical protein
MIPPHRFELLSGLYTLPGGGKPVGKAACSQMPTALVDMIVCNPDQQFFSLAAVVPVRRARYY